MGWFSRKEPEAEHGIDYTDPSKRPILGHPSDCVCVGNPHAHMPSGDEDKHDDLGQQLANVRLDWH